MMRFFVLLLVIGYMLLWLFVLTIYLFRRMRHQRLGGTVEEKILVTVPCKDTSPVISQCVESLLTQSSPNYFVTFVFGSTADSGLPAVQAIAAKYPEKSAVFVNNSQSVHCSQKIHNQLYGLNMAAYEPDILVFADSDIIYPADWLQNLCQPLTQHQNIVTTGMFWMTSAVGIWSRALAWVYNTLVVPTFANPWINYLWGGGMAIRRDDFYRLDMPAIWSKSFYDDLSLGAAAATAGMKIEYIFEVADSPIVNLSFQQCMGWIERQMVVAKFAVPFYYWLICFLVLVPALILISPFLAILDPIWWLVVAIFPFRVFSGLLICQMEGRLKEAINFPLDYFGFLIGVFGVLKSIPTRRVVWAGIHYEFTSSHGIKRLVESEMSEAR